MTLLRDWGSLRCTLLNSGLKRLVSMLTEEMCAGFSPGQSYVCDIASIRESIP